MNSESKNPKVYDMVKIDQQLFNQIYDLKYYCSSRKNCHECLVRTECHKIAQDNNGNDISCIRIGKLKDGTLIMFSESR